MQQSDKIPKKRGNIRAWERVNIKKKAGENSPASQILFGVVRFHGARCNRCCSISALHIR